MKTEFQLTWLELGKATHKVVSRGDVPNRANVARAFEKLRIGRAKQGKRPHRDEIHQVIRWGAAWYLLGRAAAAGTIDGEKARLRGEDRCVETFGWLCTALVSGLMLSIPKILPSADSDTKRTLEGMLRVERQLADADEELFG